ncbi:ABC transporter ATP-binding protein [Tsukamurella pseudospumae]|uniref:ABC transporter ATP-binding protein n=1 Tax=Tsukamurella pseudospumae TaxID=239498 RepID=A0A138A3S3_9ACTN|nr:ABC transporter ATP-binding protein [Tsukamurella pseudospumae]KXP05085.1 ABC transporter ATP-binding protein [Tsukamurella pseudospumae]
MSTALELRSLTKTYPAADGGVMTAVDTLDLTIESGEVVAFLGPNGAGKSTTIDMILGLIPPDAGTVTVFGGTPGDAVAQGRVAAVQQSGGLLPTLTVQDTVDLVAALHPGADPDAVIVRAGIDSIRTRQVGKCSGGQQQALRFALALLAEPDLLILDEPTAGMDVDARRRFWASVRADAGRGSTVLFATHYLEEADQFADRVVMIARGAIVADGPTAEVRAVATGRQLSAVVGSDGASALLAAVPGVRVAEVRGARTVFAADAEASDEALRFLLTRTDARDVEATTHGLEDAFVALTTNLTKENAR